jgi:hypothetical protein
LAIPAARITPIIIVDVENKITPKVFLITLEVFKNSPGF